MALFTKCIDQGRWFLCATTAGETLGILLKYRYFQYAGVAVKCTSDS